MRRLVLILTVLWATQARAELLRWRDVGRPHATYRDGRLSISVPNWRRWTPAFFVSVVVGDTHYGVLPERPFAVDLRGDRVPVTMTLRGLDWLVMSDPYVGVLVKDPWGYTMLPLLETLNRPSPSWGSKPRYREIHVFPEGNYHPIMDDYIPRRFVIARTRVLRPDGTVLLKQLRWDSRVDDWPDHIIIEQTLIDAVGRTEKLVDDVPVIVHQDPDGLTFTRKLWLFLAVPFLAGYLAGSILRRRRRA